MNATPSQEANGFVLRNRTSSPQCFGPYWPRSELAFLPPSFLVTQAQLVSRPGCVCVFHSPHPTPNAGTSPQPGPLQSGKPNEFPVIASEGPRNSHLLLSCLPWWYQNFGERTVTMWGEYVGNSSAKHQRHLLSFGLHSYKLPYSEHENFQGQRGEET